MMRGSWSVVTILDPHVSTRGELGHVVLTVLGMVAQMERRFIKGRQKEGIERAKSAGIYRGGKRRLDRGKVIELKAAGYGPGAIAKAGPNELRFTVSRDDLSYFPNVVPVQTFVNRFPEAQTRAGFSA